MHIVLGLIGIVLGALIVMKTEPIVSMFGTSEWAEQHLGLRGGTRLFYKLIGLTIIIVSTLGMTGLLGSIILGTFGSLFGV